MANREQRNNREKKKPKAEKGKSKSGTASNSPFEQKAQKPAAPGKK
ncbi:MAG TPA: hypothetical protein VHU23_05450 [Rhizomicrobium sp.]|jgi:hypothetical protein|nr:hypothetical protein [Rhizomicrobium sp.]